MTGAAASPPDGHVHDEVSRDAPSELDLTPLAPSRTARPRRSWIGWSVGAVMAAALGFVLYQGLSNATVFFYNVDEAVARRSETADRRIRIQGNVVDGSVVKLDQGVRFDLRFNGVVVGVDNSSDPPDLFGPAIPTVVEGRWNGTRFAGDKILVKHDETYSERNSGRLACAEADAAGRPCTPGPADRGTTPASDSPANSNAP